MKKFSDYFSGVNWINHFFAFVGTCAGVLMAFFLADYQENRNNRIRLEKAMTQVCQEIEQNKGILENHSEFIRLQVMAMDKIKPLLQEDTSIIATEQQIQQITDSFPEFFTPEIKTPINDTLFNWRGDMNVNFNLPGLSEIAWENAQALDVLHLVDFESSYQLFSLYRFQEYLKSEAHTNMETIRNLMRDTMEEKDMFKIIFTDYRKSIELLGALEKSTLIFYENVLKKLKEEY